MVQQKILIVDDEKGIRDLFAKVLSEEGYFVDTAKNGVEGLKKVKAQNFHLILIDLRMPKMSGVNAIIEMKQINPEAVFIVITGFPLERTVEKILKKGVYDCISKPFNLTKVLKKIKKALERRQK